MAGCAREGCQPAPANRQANILPSAPFPECFGEADAGAPTVRFAVIGDFGHAGPDEARVAGLVNGWRPDFVVTLGDNNYPNGGADTIDENVGQYFHAFISPYRGRFGAGAADNRFFPSLGNHDWLAPGAEPYRDYFTLPGNERYYDFVRGNVRLFALDSDVHEPDGVTADSVQAGWLRSALSAATEKWRVVYLHHPPYSSGPHGSTGYMQWPFASWGATLVLSGHDHDYERVQMEGITYVVCGVGGAPTYQFGPALPGTKVRIEAAFGAGLVEARENHLRFRFYSVDGAILDEACF